jgi:ribosomal peptide maturation radical SAM protein 1
MSLDRLNPLPASASVCGDPASLDPDTRALRAAWPVALVSMPFALPTRPSMQLGLLAELARSHGFTVDTFHLGLDLARRIGVERYHHLACTRNPMFGDWLFSVEAFGGEAPDLEGTMPEDLDPLSRPLLTLVDMTADEIRELRRTIVPAYLDELVSSIDWARYRVVGFTSTFQQNVASFALARRIKETWPTVITLFGGANFDGPMAEALMRSVQWIDLAVSGEGDRAFPALLLHLCQGLDPLEVPGVLTRSNGAVLAKAAGPPLQNLDGLPIPDYAEYFERAEELDLLSHSQVREVDIPFESSRGCWWGEKATCRFCGLNGSTMRYRGKSPRRVLNELETLARRHKSLAFTAADNILDLDFLRSLMAPLATSDSDYWIFYEVKANLSRDDLRLLHRAGVRAVQPGIESLSTHVLKLMRKGTRASHNVDLLRWARYYGIETYWNLLLGFPGETEEDYAEQTRLVRSLVHLPPPGGSVRIGLERFSPYFEDSISFPVRGGRAVPEPGYAHTYPPAVNLDEAAYHFAGELEGSLSDEAYEPLLNALRAWHASWQQQDPPSLTFWWSPGLLQIEDRRSVLSAATYCFEDPLAALYAACSERPVTLAQLRKRLRPGVNDHEVEEALNEFCNRGLMMRDGRQFLSLAVPGTSGR